MSKPVSFGSRLQSLADSDPARTAILFVTRDGNEHRMSFHELDRESNQVARLMTEAGAVSGRMAVVALPNVPAHFVASLAGWKVGACVLPLSPALPEPERDALLALADPAIVISSWEDLAYPNISEGDLKSAHHLSDAPHPDVTAQPGKAIGSGGSTGRPKLIVDPSPWARTPGLAAGDQGILCGFRPGQVQLIMNRLYHNIPFSWAHAGLFDGHTIVLMEHFDPTQALDLIERHRVQFLRPAPINMQRMLGVPDIETRDLGSIESLYHGAAVCPPWVKRRWIALIGAHKVWEGFGAAEGNGATYIRGDEWLKHPGSIGRPEFADVRIIADSGEECAVGEVGEIYMRARGVDSTYEYLGSNPARSIPGGFLSVGDLGWIDADGYLYLADRRVDIVITGGANVYPAEVEAALSEHPEVDDVAVIPLPDEEWGKRVHAVIQPRHSRRPPSLGDLDSHCRARVAAFKCPKSYDFVEQLPRDPSGKIRRSALVAARAEAQVPVVFVKPGRAAAS